MSHSKQTSATDVREERTDSDGTTRDLEVWSMMGNDADFPSRLRAASGQWSALRAIGDRSILKQTMLGLICSVQCPGSVIIRAFDAIREVRDAGVVVAGGFHSPMEGECLEFLMRGDQAVVICPAKGVPALDMPSSWREAVNARRLLVVSPFADNVRRTTKRQAELRNEFVSCLGVAVLIPHASPGGKAEAAAQRILGRQQSLYTFDDDANTRLLSLGAHPYDLEAIRRQVAAGGPS